MNTRGLSGFGLGLLLVGLLGHAAPAADSAKDRAKWRLATLAAARSIADEFGQTQPLPAQDRLVLMEGLQETMRREPAAHVAREESRRRCATLAVQLRRQALKRRLEEAARHASEQSPLPVRPAEITAQLGAGWTHALEQALQAFVATEVDPLFRDARARAVGLQRQEVEQQLRFPTEAQLNALLGECLAAHPADLRLAQADAQQLQQKLLALANPERKPYFEELKTVPTDTTRRMADEIQRQYERQLALRDETLRSGIPAERRQASAILPLLERGVTAGLAREQAKPAPPDVNGKPVPRYPLLAPIQRSLPTAAGQLETDRLKEFLAHAPALTLPADDLARRIRAEPEKHVTPAASEALLLHALPAPCGAAAAQAYAAGAQPPAPRDYFPTLLRTNATLAAALTERVQAELRARLPEARQRISDEQFKAHFSALEREAPLPPEALTWLQDRGGRALQTPAEVRALFGLPARDDKALLEETVRRTLELANRQAREAYGVLTAQLGLLRQLERERLEKLRQEVVARRPFRQIRAEWLQALEAGWQADPRARSTPYAQLLAPTLAALEKTVRQLYDALQENPAATLAAPPAESRPTSETEQGREKELRQNPAQPEEPKPDVPKTDQPPAPQPSPKAGGREGVANALFGRVRVDRRNEPDGVLLLTSAKGGGGTARLLNPTGGASTPPVPFAPGKPQEAAAAIFEAIRPGLEKLWTSTVQQWQEEHSGLGMLKRRTPPKLRLFVVIQSDEIRHRMSLRLRQHIDEAFADWRTRRGPGTPEVELEWKVGLTFDAAGAGTPEANGQDKREQRRD